MNVLVTRNAINVVGGAELSALRLCISLEEMGESAVLSTGIEKLRAASKEADIKTVDAPWFGNGYGFRTMIKMLLKLPGWARYYKKLIKENAIDVVNAQSRDDQIILTLLKPYHRTSVVWTDHGDMKHLLSLAKSDKYMGGIYRWCIRRADSIIFVSQEEKRLVQGMLDEQNITELQNLTVIPNGIRVADYDADAKVQIPGIGKKDAVVGIVCNLFAAKGGETLLKLVASLRPETACLIVGDGPERSHLEALAKKLGIENRVHFVGSQKDVSGFINRMDVFILPTDYEGAPLSTLEAMYLSRPVVAYAVGGIPEQITDNLTGFLIDHGDYDGLRKQVMALLQDSKMRDKIGNNAHNAILKDFDSNKILSNKYLPLLKSFSKGGK